MKRGEEKNDTRVVGKTFLDLLLCLRLLDGLLEVDGGGGHGVCVGAKRLASWYGVMVYGKKGSYMVQRQTHIQGDVTINCRPTAD